MAAMLQDKYVFSHLTTFLDRTRFHNYVCMYKTVKKCKRGVLKNIKLTKYLSEKKDLDSCRLVLFLTNAMQLSALDVANLYKKDG